MKQQELFTQQELFDLHEETSSKCLEIMRKKNADYSGGCTNPFENFLSGENVDVRSESGILLRITDKIQRIRSFIANGRLEVAEESVFDAIEDNINYFIILKGLIIYKQRVSKREDRIKMALDLLESAESSDSSDTQPNVGPVPLALERDHNRT